VLLLVGFVFSFWFAFSTFYESFFRDDNVGGPIPVLVDMVRTLLHGGIPDHTYGLGGGGGAALLVSMTGLLDPFVFVPSLLMSKDSKLLCNFIVSLHLGIFAAGGYLLGLTLGAPRWARIVAGVSLAFSGYFVIWVGNWIFFILPYVFLPWIAVGILKILGAKSPRELLAYEVMTFATGLLMLGIGGPTAPFYSGIAILVMVAYILVSDGSIWKKFLLRLSPLGILFLAVAVPLLLGQKKLYDWYGGRVPDPADWVDLSVPLSAYLGLLIPSTHALWRIGWMPLPVLTSNTILMAGVVPAWFVLGAVLRKPALFLAPRILSLLAGLILFVFLMSPASFHLSLLFTEIPVLNYFRWTFRAIPAFHFVFIVLFLRLAAEPDFAIQRRWQIAAVVVCVGASALCIGHEVSLMQVRNPNLTWGEELNISKSRSPVLSWYHVTPHLDNPDSWDESVLERLRNAGYIMNICSSDNPFHDKPRLFFHGNSGLFFGVRTVHLYVVPYVAAYDPLGMSGKGCIKNWQTAKYFIENGPQKPLPEKVTWENPLGPRDFSELMTKTYVGAVVVDALCDQPMQYFLTSPNWQLLAKNQYAAVFLRTQSSKQTGIQ
jgi:hypothetical protein